MSIVAKFLSHAYLRFINSPISWWAIMIIALLFLIVQIWFSVHMNLTGAMCASVGLWLCILIDKILLK